MIANPSVPAFRYDPYSKKFTRELYEHEEMRGVRADAVRKARKTLVESGSGSWAVVLGTLGRQGSLAVLKVGGSWHEHVMPFCVAWSSRDRSVLRRPPSVLTQFFQQILVEPFAQLSFPWQCRTDKAFTDNTILPTHRLRAPSSPPPLRTISGQARAPTPTLDLRADFVSQTIDRLGIRLRPPLVESV